MKNLAIQKFNRKSIGRTLSTYALLISILYVPTKSFVLFYGILTLISFAYFISNGVARTTIVSVSSLLIIGMMATIFIIRIIIFENLDDGKEFIKFVILFLLSCNARPFSLFISNAFLLSKR